MAQLYTEYKADRVIAEGNQGGDLVTEVLKTAQRGLPIKVVHASRGKMARAEPVAALYEQGKVHHVGSFPQLEDELTGWAPGNGSPNRLDALVWGATELFEAGVPSYEYTPVPRTLGGGASGDPWLNAEAHAADADARGDGRVRWRGRGGGVL